MAFAIVYTGGKQYKVSPGMKVKVEKLEGKEGDNVTLDKVILLSKDDVTAEIGKPYLKTEVKAKIVKQARTDKVRVFKMKSKKNYQRTKGHRQYFTELEIVSL